MGTTSDEVKAQTFETWTRHWLATEMWPKKSTFDRYRREAERHIFPLLKDVPMTEVSAEDVRRVMKGGREAGLSEQTLGIIHAVISGSCRAAFEAEMIDDNPARRVRSPKAHSPEVIPAEPDIVRTLLLTAEAENHPCYALLHTLAHTGMRRSEALALKWCNVDLESGHIRITEAAVKSDGEGLRTTSPKSRYGNRTITLDLGTVQVLKDHRARLEKSGIKSEYVFPGADGTVFKPTTLHRMVKELGARVGWPDITIHKFRHFSASISLENDETGLATSRRLGHSSIETTFDQYGHLFKGQQVQVADDIAERINATGSSVRNRRRGRRRKLRGK